MYTINLRRRTKTTRLIGFLLVSMGILSILYPPSLIGDQVFGVLLGVFGAGLFGWLNQIRIDKSNEQLLVQIGWFIPLRTKKYELKKVRKLVLREHQKRNGDDWGSQFYSLSLGGIRGSMVLKNGNPWFVRHIAETLAVIIGVPIDNRVYKKSSVRSPDILAIPLVEQWRKNRVTFALPSHPSDTQLTIRRQRDVLKVYIPAETQNFKWVLIWFIAFLVGAAFIYPITREYPFAFFGMFVPFFVASVFILLAFSGKSLLTISTTTVSFRQGLSLFKSAIPINEIKELIFAYDGPTLVGDNKAVWVHWASNQADSDYLQKVIPYEISVRTPAELIGTAARNRGKTITLNK